MSIDSPHPETRLSLLARVCGAEDHAAWQEFVELYAPVIYRTARYAGLQDADADDVTQQVLVSVARALEQRPHDPNRAKFRTWLSRVSRNATLNALQRVKPDRGSGDSALQRRLNAVAEHVDPEQILDREMQKQIFRAAADLIEAEFETATWRAFWLTAIEGRDASDVAKELGKNVGSIYAARSRIMRRLREAVGELQGDGS